VNSSQTNWVLYKNGNQEALGEIFQTYFQELYFYGLKIIAVPDLVKDIIQELFVKLWDRKESIGEVANVKAYLLVSLRNDLIHTIKNNRLIDSEFSKKTEPFTLSAEDFIINEEDSNELKDRLVTSLNRLSERQREVIVLRFYHNLGFEELAEVMEMNTQSVRNLLFRALQSIRIEIKDSGFHSPENIEIILFHLFSKK
jgi:RNA polymerase sigma factor (sigma-70 family)